MQNLPLLSVEQKLQELELQTVVHFLQGVKIIIFNRVFVQLIAKGSVYLYAFLMFIQNENLYFLKTKEEEKQL